MSGLDTTTERRLSLMEAQVAVLGQIANRQENHSGVLTSLERGILEMRGEVKAIGNQIIRLQKDHDKLESEILETNENHKKAIGDIVNTVVSSFQQMIENLKTVTNKMYDAHHESVTKDIEPRLRSLERKIWYYIGAVGLLAVLAMIYGPSIVTRL